jgi:hypothetical protein
MGTFQELVNSLNKKIQESYEQGITLESAERLASEFLFALMQVSTELKKADLNARMRKAGVKAIRGAIYHDIVSKADKKPTEGAIEHQLNTDELVRGEQSQLDEAEVDKAELERHYEIFNNAHIHFRGIAKGSFGG